MGSNRAEADVSDFAGTPLETGSVGTVASVAEDRLELATQAAALRRELADTRAQLASWDRTDGELDLAVGTPRGSSRGGSQDQLIDLSGATEKLRRRLIQSDHDLEEVQVERDEALAQLRREMFSNLLYTTIIGECGQRNTQRGVAKCSDQVRDTLRPRWGRFESCVRDYNAIPAYSQETSAQNVHNALRLSRGAVLMCDPGLPEGGDTQPR